MATECSYQTRRALANRTSIMGEEKPEEELMGKRKSSPRLSATPLRRYPYLLPKVSATIHRRKKFFPKWKFYAETWLC